MRTNHSFRPMAVSLTLFACLGTPAFGQAAESDYLGKADCRIAPLEPVPGNGKVTWTGACEDGYASGKGILAWRTKKEGEITLEATLVRGEVSGEGILTKEAAYKYTGSLKNGVPHGRGFFAYENGKGWYEGEVANGLPHGEGERLYLDRTRYVGQLVEGNRHGRGEATFTTGGSYSGEWQDDRFHGQGKIVYAGSARSFEGRFEDGRIAGQQKPVASTARHALTDQRSLAFPRPALVSGTVPLRASWDKLTEAEKNTVRSKYAALEAGDEPPFPEQGERALFTQVVAINQKTGLNVGDLVVHVLVEADGRPKTATAYGAPNPTLARAVSAAMMLQKYKPALCQGEPCAMVYPLHFKFSIDP